MNNIKTTIATLIAGATMLVLAEGTFETFNFNTPVFQEDDPLGFTTLTNTVKVANDAKESASNATEKAEMAQAVADDATNKIAKVESDLPTTIDSRLTNDVVIIGQTKGTAFDAGVKVNTNSIILAVNKGVEEMSTEDGDILLGADRIRLDADPENIVLGGHTLKQILEESGSEAPIETIKVNGTALVPDADKAVDITIPTPGDVNVIEGITTNGVDVVPDGNKKVNIVIPSAGEGNVIESITTNGAPVAVTDKNVDIVIPTPGDANVIESITTNGAPVEVIGKNVNIVIPSAGEGNVLEVVKTNGVALTIQDKSVDIAIPAPGEMNVIESITTNGVALPINGKSVELPSIDGKLDAKFGVATGSIKVQPDPDDPDFVIGDGKVEVTHKSVKFLNTTSVPDTEYKEDEILSGGESYKFDDSTNGVARLKDVASATNNLALPTSKIIDLDSYKNPTISAGALEAISTIDTAPDIATIKGALTNFLYKFVIVAP